MIVDETPVVRRMIEYAAKACDLPVDRLIQAADNFEAIQILDAQRVHLVVADASTPRINGVELLRAMRTPGSGAPPLALITDQAQDTSQAAMAASPMPLFYLRRPYTLDQVGKIFSEVFSTVQQD